MAYSGKCLNCLRYYKDCYCGQYQMLDMTDERVNDVVTGRAVLPTNSQERKDTPIYSGVLRYFPRALAYIAKVSKVGNDKHNPGQPLHWSKGKSNDHGDCVARHLLEAGTVDPEDNLRHSGKLAWRALALLEIELENGEKSA